MFEAGLIESRHEIRTKTRWTLMASIVVQGSLLAGLIVLPLLSPVMMHLTSVTVMPAPVLTQPKPVVVQVRNLSASAGPSMPAQIEIATNTRTSIQNPFARATQNAPVTSIGPMGQIGMPGGVLIGEIERNVAGPGDAKRGPLHVSQGVMEGRLVVPIAPEYPRIAVASGVQGTVVVQATISETGRIVDARVVSGPLMLRNAALDAVRRARYEPYKLSGEAVSVETTVSIVFNLGG